MVFQAPDTRARTQDATAAHYSRALDRTDNDKYQIFNDNL